MGRLVYHDLSGISGQFSPFDAAVLEVAQSGSVRIVSPYIGVDYIQRIIQVSCEWQLISDIEAWLSSLSVRARPKAWLFIRKNLHSIHHCPAIHAKAVISKTLAMFGSANLTNTGILGRTEMGILIDEPAMVSELGAWFDTLWEQTLPPIADETNAFVQWLDDEAGRAPARRERFSLSTSSKKIRARLSQLPTPQKSETVGAALNLDAVAQALTVQEQRHYDSLEEAVEVAINALARESFLFGQAADSVCQAFPTASTREIYFVLLQHCANHVRSVFAENTINRLILKDGKFIQSTRELITQALAPFDSFLSYLVHHFYFSQARNLPDEDSIEQQMGIRGSDQVVLISELSDCGFLEIDDIAGQLPRYCLSEDFLWEGRYQLFAAARHDWIAKKNRPAQKVTLPINVDASEDDGFPEDRVGKVSDEALKIAYAQVEKQRRVKIDKVLSHILARLFSGEKLQSSKNLFEQISKEVNVRPQLVQVVIAGIGMDMPKVILKTQNGVSINPDLDWKDLTDYPLTQNVCKTFLGGIR